MAGTPDLVLLARKALKAIRLLREPRWRAGLRHGVAASLEGRAVLRDLEVGLVIDAGAHHGQFSLLAAALWPQAEIHAFEPQPDAARRFMAVFAGDRRVHLHRCALGAADGTAALTVSRRSDNSSLLPPSPAQIDFAPGTGPAGRIDVPLRRLDGVLSVHDLAGRPTLLKIDVQGSELEVLRGAEGLLGAVDHVYAEVSFLPLYEGQPLADSIVAFLAGHGLRMAGIGGVARDRRERCVQADFLFARRTPGGPARV
ncbi:MAG TPA: FkbM family methyltransferase [Azospirillaceae bacterium]|nr:FkbM family methyltransferase [Azospirillaceae bacterium]